MPVLAVFSVFSTLFAYLNLFCDNFSYKLRGRYPFRRDGSIRALRKLRFRNKTREVAIFKTRVGDGGGDGGDGGDDGGDGGDGRIFPEHPGPIIHAPRDIISRKGKSLTPITF